MLNWREPTMINRLKSPRGGRQPKFQKVLPYFETDARRQQENHAGVVSTLHPHQATDLSTASCSITIQVVRDQVLLPNAHIGASLRQIQLPDASTHHISSTASVVAR